MALDAAGEIDNQGAVEGEQVAVRSGSFHNSGSLSAYSGASVVTAAGAFQKLALN